MLQEGGDTGPTFGAEDLFGHFFGGGGGGPFGSFFGGFGGGGMRGGRRGPRRGENTVHRLKYVTCVFYKFLFFFSVYVFHSSFFSFF